MKALTSDKKANTLLNPQLLLKKNEGYKIYLILNKIFEMENEKIRELGKQEIKEFENQGMKGLQNLRIHELEFYPKFGNQGGRELDNRELKNWRIIKLKNQKFIPEDTLKHNKI